LYHALKKKLPCAFDLIQGTGRHPHQDPWGVEFSETYYPDRFQRAGERIAGPFTFVCDGIQGDADFIASLFQLKRPTVSVLRIFLKKRWNLFWNINLIDVIERSEV